MEPEFTEKVEKRERIACLYLTFLNHPGGLSFRHIKKSLPLAYQGDSEAARRKFERDKEDLKKLGIDLIHYPPGSVTSKGREVHDHIYVPSSDIRYLPELNFSAEEARSLASVLYRAVRRLKENNQDASLLESAAAKLFFNIPEALFIDEIFKNTPQIQARNRSDDETSSLAVIHEAIRNRKLLSFEYESSSRIGKRSVEARGLIAHRGRWCLVAFCRTAGGIRHFYLDNIKNIEAVNERFEPDKNFKISLYLLHPLAIRNHEKIKVKIFYSENYEDAVSDYISEIPPALEPEKKENYFTCNVTNIEALYSWILKNPGIAEDIEPEDIKKKYNDFINEIRDYYH